MNTYSIEHTVASEIENVENAVVSDMVIYPNPASSMVNIKYNIVNDGNVKIILYNVLGEKVTDMINNSQVKGIYKSEFDMSSLPSGIYTCRMYVNNIGLITKRITISR